MISAVSFCAALKLWGYGVVAGVPCSCVQSVLDQVERDPELTYLAAPNEGAALAIAAGAHLGGRKSCVLIQNSGLGNLVNPLTSLSLIYRIPTLLLISVRGYPDGREDEPQHAIMGRSTLSLLSLLGIDATEMPDEPAAFEQALAEMDRRMTEDEAPGAFVIRKGTIVAEANLQPPSCLDYQPLTRLGAIQLVAEAIDEQTVVVSTTGHISREWASVAHRPSNFYMQGSMGHAASIALGLALARPERRVLVLDGDGAILMHLGACSTIGHYALPNLVHVVLDNEAYESTGNQRTTSSTTAIEAVAHACGYRHALRCATQAELMAALQQALTQPGPAMVLAKVSRRPSPPAPRITAACSPSEIATTLRSWLLGQRQGV